jgi:hypothetical protein
VQSALVSIHVKGTYCVVEVMSHQPADDDADNAEEVEVAYQSQYCEQSVCERYIPMPRVEKP